jgi:hypothetical protein
MKPVMRSLLALVGQIPAANVVSAGVVAIGTGPALAGAYGEPTSVNETDEVMLRIPA